MRHVLQNKLLSIVIALTVIFIVFVGFTASRRDRVSIFEGVIGNVLSPVQKYLYNGGQRINNLFNFVINISSISKENSVLKEKVSNLEKKTVDFDNIKNENERLRGMLEFKNRNNSYSYLGANVIGKGSGNWYDVFIIDKGSNHGVKKFYPVVTSQGLVGQVMEVGPNWAKVLSIIDEKSRVSGAISKTGDQGIIQGIPGFNSDKNCKMLYLQAKADIQQGDFVVTSGISKFFPPNIIIGTVYELNDDKTDFVKSVTVKPNVDFSKLEGVFVITNSISKNDYPEDYQVEGN